MGFEDGTELEEGDQTQVLPDLQSHEMLERVRMASMERPEGSGSEPLRGTRPPPGTPLPPYRPPLGGMEGGVLHRGGQALGAESSIPNVPIPTANTLKPYTGEWLYNGSPGEFYKWDQIIRSALGLSHLHVCLTDEDYYGFDARTQKPVKLQHVPPENIHMGLDMQSHATIYMATTLTGVAASICRNMHTEYERYANDPRKAPVLWRNSGSRRIPSAYTLYMAIKDHAKPDASQERLQDDMSVFYNCEFPKVATYDSVMVWVNDMERTVDEMALQGCEAWLNEPLFCMHACMIMQEPRGPHTHQEIVSMQTIAGYQTPRGMTRAGLKKALRHQYPYTSKPKSNMRMMNIETGNETDQSPKSGDCGICGRQHKGPNTHACFEHKDHEKHCKSKNCYHYRLKKKPEAKEDKGAEKTNKDQQILAAYAAKVSPGITAEQATAYMTQQQAAPGAPTATPQMEMVGGKMYQMHTDGALRPYDGRAEGHKAYGLALTLPQVGAPNSRLP